MAIKETLARICALQPKYSSSNTPEMQERGYLIRTELAGELRDRIPALQGAFDGLFDDLSVDASDGIGRKTEAPWVRLHSKTMSPNPREGFYLVIHFAADGSAVFFTVGCGSTIWSGGDLRPVSDEELFKRTSWARSVIQQKWGTLAPFEDEIALGASAPLPKTFEKATAIARRVPATDLESADVDSILFQAAERLSEIYLAQLDQRDVSQGDRDADEVVSIVRPLRPQRRRQGAGLSAAERKAVELQAMQLAAEYLQSQGYQTKDTSSTESFDILASRDGLSIKVEVKGTTSDLCDSIMMTKNEVDLHRGEKGTTGLIIVSAIKLVRSDSGPTASAGKLEALLHWDIDEWEAAPIAFQVFRH
jgi:MrcB-like, N-terminal domain/Domain of unknown function (DUF3883)